MYKQDLEKSLKDLNNILSLLDSVNVDSDNMLNKALKDLEQLDSEKSKELRNLATRIKNPKNEEEAQKNIKELMKRCQ